MNRARRPCPAKEPDLVWCECPATSPCVLQECRALGMPGGKERALEAYRKECAIRQAQLSRRGAA